MNTRFFGLAIGATLAALSALSDSQAREVSSGVYRLAVGTANPCRLTLATDGTVDIDADCNHLAAIGRWHPTPSGLELTDKDGAAIADLKSTDEGYTGLTKADHKQLFLSR